MKAFWLRWYAGIIVLAALLAMFSGALILRLCH
jgi:hypothetical protein